MEEQLYFVNKIVSELMNKKSIVMSEEKYKQKIKSMKAKEKITMSYEKYRDQKYLLVFLGAYAVTLQTAIPDISSKKTYENCIRSFSGFLTRR